MTTPCLVEPRPGLPRASESKAEDDALRIQLNVIQKYVRMFVFYVTLYLPEQDRVKVASEAPNGTKRRRRGSPLPRPWLSRRTRRRLTGGMPVEAT